MTTPPSDSQRDPDPHAGDHDPTVRFGGAQPPPPPPPPPPPGASFPPPPPPGQGPGWGVPGAPYGIDPKTGIPFSDKSKIIAGLLQLIIPLGIGRFYTGHTSMGVAQLVVTLVTCGIGALWPFIDGILILVSDSRDANGRPLRS